MRYVLDASVSLRWVLPGPHSAKALRLRADLQNKIHDLIAPETFIGENANGLIKAERQKSIPPGQAVVQYADIMSTAPTFFPFRPHVSRALAIASTTRAGFYDCLYVSLAEQEQCELATADDRMLKNPQAQFPFIVSLASMP